MGFFDYFKSKRELIVRVDVAESSLSKASVDAAYWRAEAFRAKNLWELAKLGHIDAQNYLYDMATKDKSSKKD